MRLIKSVFLSAFLVAMILEIMQYCTCDIDQPRECLATNQALMISAF